MAEFITHVGQALLMAVDMIGQIAFGALAAGLFLLARQSKAGREGLLF
jgi:hypothetical protein